MGDIDSCIKEESHSVVKEQWSCSEPCQVRAASLTSIALGRPLRDNWVVCQPHLPLCWSWNNPDFLFKCNHKLKVSFWPLELLLATFFITLSVQLLFILTHFSLSSLRHAIKAVTVYFSLHATIEPQSLTACPPLWFVTHRFKNRDLTPDLAIT